MNKDKINCERIDKVNQALPQENKNYFWQLLIAIDQLLNTLLCGWADETLSSRAYRKSEYSKNPLWKFVRRFIDLVFALFNDFDHCEKAFINESARMHLPQYYRDVYLKTLRENKDV